MASITKVEIWISIHALREEGDGERSLNDLYAYLFQSTPSARRATSGSHGIQGGQNYFNPRPPRGGRRSDSIADFTSFVFQSTPSARRATFCTAFVSCPAGSFQSTPSARRATLTGESGFELVPISIHALREEGDRDGLALLCAFKNFNPRPPRGGRRHL